MQKRTVQGDSRVARRTNTVSLPEIVDIDVLGGMQDEDLILHLRALDDDRLRASEIGYDQLPWEVELAYVRREQQIRRTRRDVHQEISHREGEEHYRREASLPEGDFDNFAFVYAATGGRPRWN